MPNVREHYLKVADRLTDVLLDDPERWRETLREFLGERIRLKPDESGQFLWADYSLEISALLPSAEIMVAGAMPGEPAWTTRVRVAA
jgi:hypothetical protein